jgi:hypothetical protein
MTAEPASVVDYDAPVIQTLVAVGGDTLSPIAE